MSYNGIGLQTPRGSGTSGYVQRNSASIIDSNQQDKAAGGLYRTRQLQKHEEDREARAKNPVEQDKEIQEHNKKREIEVKCMELRDQLEDDDVDESIIEKKVSELRDSLLRRSSDNRDRSPIRSKGDKNHKEDKGAIAVESKSYDKIEDSKSTDAESGYKTRYNERVKRNG